MIFLTNKSFFNISAKFYKEKKSGKTEKNYFIERLLRIFIINKKRTTSVLTLVISIGKTGFEPATPWSQTKYSTKLSYFPS